MKTIESYIDWSSTREARRERDVDNVIGLAYFHIPLYEYAKKSAKVMEYLLFLHFGNFSKDCEKSDQKCSQDPPKSSET